MKKSVWINSKNPDDVWKCCECETEYLLPDNEINEVDYDFGDEVLTVLVCNKCMYKLNPELLKEIR